MVISLVTLSSITTAASHKDGNFALHAGWFRRPHVRQTLFYMGPDKCASSSSLLFHIKEAVVACNIEFFNYQSSSNTRDVELFHTLLRLRNITAQCTWLDQCTITQQPQNNQVCVYQRRTIRHHVYDVSRRKHSSDSTTGARAAHSTQRLIRQDTVSKLNVHLY